MAEKHFYPNFQGEFTAPISYFYFTFKNPEKIANFRNFSQLQNLGGSSRKCLRLDSKVSDGGEGGRVRKCHRS